MQLLHENYPKFSPICWLPGDPFKSRAITVTWTPGNPCGHAQQGSQTGIIPG